MRDSLAKMSALNEGLAQDKMELNQILIQVRGLRVVSAAGEWGGGIALRPQLLQDHARLSLACFVCGAEAKGQALYPLLRCP